MDKNLLNKLAGELDAAPRTKTEAAGEGQTVITLSDELAKKLAADLRAAGATPAVVSDKKFAEQFGAKEKNEAPDGSTEFVPSTAN
jgi:hypothetical protein